MEVKIEESWQKLLGDEFEKPYFKTLLEFVENEYAFGEVFPPKELIFNAFNFCKFENVRVVLLGQDPYHGAGQAHGLAFSVPEGVKPPPSLKNIFKEIGDNFSSPAPADGNLERWAQQGVFLLNATLTVRAAQPTSHQNRGWERFTDGVIRRLSDQRDGLVFLLWGASATKKAALIDGEKHLILTAPHPSPLSAYRGFFGCEHFLKANEFLVKNGLKPIDWR